MTDDTAFELTVATYNIRLGIQQGLPAIASAILSRCRPDILAIQEVGHRWTMGPDGDTTTELAEALGLSHQLYIPTIERPQSTGSPARYGHALLTRWPITAHEIVALPRHDDEPRALSQSEISAGNTSLTVMTTHLSHRDSDRPSQGHYFVDWLSDRMPSTDAQFILGDLNATRSEPWLADLLSQWTDADAEKQRPTFPAKDPQHRIDYVLGRNAQLLDTQVPPLVEPSDHRPVISRWRIAD